MFRRRVTPLSAALLCLVAVAACTSSSSGTRRNSPAPPVSTASGTATTVPSSSGSGTALPAGSLYYVSLGDSYAAGYQATGKGQGHTTNEGFADQTVPLAKARGYDLRLVNFGCAGATTASVLRTPGCRQGLEAPGAPAYSTTQAAAAEAFLRAHRGHIGLVTVSIGGNDVIPCGASSDPVGCLTRAIGPMRTNATTLARGLRAAAGPSARLVGTTYPDVLLGDYLSPNAQLKSLAGISTTAFRSLINPALEAGYAAAGGGFADVTAATGAYGPTTAMTTVPPLGRIPVPVAKICLLTYYCQYQDIHPRAVGYAVIARLVAAQLPTR